MVVSVTLDGPVARVTIDNPPVNATSQAVRQGLLDALAQTETADAIRIVILSCAGRTFVAGADVSEFNAPPLLPHLPDVCAAIEAAQKPWVAALHGSTLGGGMEIAMACAYRIAAPNTQLGLPEVMLGLIPGAGGTMRLPRLVGPANALTMIAGGKPISALRAVEMGLIDAIATDDLHTDAQRFAREMADAPPPTPVSERPIPAYDRAALASQIAQIKAKARGQNSPAEACQAVENATDMPATAALTAERATFLRLKDDPQSHALRHIFFAERSASKIPAIKGHPAPSLTQIGVIGGGTMGAGIAAACLLAGLTVTMIERDAAALETGLDRTRNTIAGSAKRGLITPTQHDTMLQSLHGSTDYAALSNADLVIEAVFEDMAIKHAVFAALDAATKPDAILASNTSYLDISEIAAATRDPSRVIGLHFFSPAHVMKLLELVIPPQAAPRAIAMGTALGKRLRKITVPSGVCDGFIGNRIMSAYRRACDYMIADGALPAQIDTAMRDFGFPMGVFEMQDLAGLDIAWAMRKRRAVTRDPAERYIAIADQLCEAGRFGRKTGRGWYIYDGKTAQVDPDITALIATYSADNNITRRPFTDAEIITEILTVMQAEGDAILSEGIAARPSDIDVVMVNGYGFPRWRGGPMFMKS